MYNFFNLLAIKRHISTGTNKKSLKKPKIDTLRVKKEIYTDIYPPIHLGRKGERPCVVEKKAVRAADQLLTNFSQHYVASCFLL
jgi:hypothetical protein